MKRHLMPTFVIGMVILICIIFSRCEMQALGDTSREKLLEAQLKAIKATAASQRKQLVELKAQLVACKTTIKSLRETCARLLKQIPTTKPADKSPKKVAPTPKLSAEERLILEYIVKAQQRDQSEAITLPSLRGPLRIGQIGIFVAHGYVEQVIDKSNMTIRMNISVLTDDFLIAGGKRIPGSIRTKWVTRPHIIWLSGISTVGVVDDSQFGSGIPFQITGTKKYARWKTVFVAKPYDLTRIKAALKAGK